MTLFLGGGGDMADSIAIDSVFFEDIKVIGRASWAALFQVCVYVQVLV